MFLNFVFYERTSCLHVLKIGCCLRWFKQILGRNITSHKLPGWEAAVTNWTLKSHWQILHWLLGVSSVPRFVLTEVNMCKRGYLLWANLLIRRQSARVNKTWALFKNRGSSCKRSLSLLPQLSRGQFAENGLGAFLSNRNACYAGYWNFVTKLQECHTHIITPYIWYTLITLLKLPTLARS